MVKKFVILGMVLVFVSLSAAFAVNEPYLISFQGRLEGVEGDSADIDFFLYDNEGGTPPAVWSESHAGVPLDDGIFNVRLGSSVAFDNVIYDNLSTGLWLRTRVNGRFLAPLQPLTAAPYALVAQRLNAVTTSRTPLVVAQNADGIGILAYSAKESAIAGAAVLADKAGVAGGNAANGGIGVYGSATNGYGVQGVSANKVAVYGESTAGTGLWGESTNGYGVYGKSTSTTGIFGQGGGSADGTPAVYGNNTSSGPGVRAQSTSGKGLYATTNGANVPAMYATNTYGGATPSHEKVALQLGYGRLQILSDQKTVTPTVHEVTTNAIVGRIRINNTFWGKVSNPYVSADSIILITLVNETESSAPADGVIIRDQDDGYFEFVVKSGILDVTGYLNFLIINY